MLHQLRVWHNRASAPASARKRRKVDFSSFSLGSVPVVLGPVQVAKCWALFARRLSLTITCDVVVRFFLRLRSWQVVNLFKQRGFARVGTCKVVIMCSQPESLRPLNPDALKVVPRELRLSSLTNSCNRVLATFLWQPWQQTSLNSAVCSLQQFRRHSSVHAFKLVLEPRM